ncbi:MAG: type II toxin-antitoxin system VapB family antitoxin [Spirochaetia bacterium]|nr:type II toxin-antitoxin system VapB family antitoxin [Spirochaetia bacterium]
MHYLWIFIYIRTTIDLNEELLLKARELTYIKGKTELIDEGLKALIQEMHLLASALLNNSSLFTLYKKLKKEWLIIFNK